MLLLSRLAAVVLLSAAFVSGAFVQVHAQTQTQTPPADQSERVIGGPLANIRVLQMSVAPLSQQSQDCGLDPDVILANFQQPLKAKGIVVQDAALVWVQLEATTVRYQDDICISYIEARAIQNTRYFDRKTESERSGRVLLWTDGGLYLSGVSNHGVTTNIGWANLAKSFMQKWQMDQ